MKVLVLGATCGIGRLIVPDALENVHSVVALIRSKARAPDLPGADIIEGDACDEGVLIGALDGCDAVVSSLGPALALSVRSACRPKRHTHWSKRTPVHL